MHQSEADAWREGNAERSALEWRLPSATCGVRYVEEKIERTAGPANRKLIRHVRVWRVLAAAPEAILVIQLEGLPTFHGPPPRQFGGRRLGLVRHIRHAVPARSRWQRVPH